MVETGEVLVLTFVWPRYPQPPASAEVVAEGGDLGSSTSMNEETHTSSAKPVGGEHGHSTVAAISRDIVRIHAVYYGRGPTRAKTIWRDEIIVCLLRDIFTKAEQLLVDAGRFEDVRAHRIAFQDEVEPLLRQCVETTTGRGVTSFLSQISIDGAAAEVFVLDGPLDPA